MRKFSQILGLSKLYEYWLWRQVKDGRMPSHVALILDGNRRWARKRGAPPWIGHKEGAKKVEEVLKWCLDLGIKTITLYTFSMENFNRSEEEVHELMKIFEQYLNKLRDSEIIYANEVHVKAIGRTYLLPRNIQELLREIEERTNHFQKYFLNIAIAYGGRAEITDAVKRIAEDVKKGRLEVSEINDREISVYSAPAQPRPGFDNKD